MADSRRAVVIGTGAGGLSAAAHLAKRGFDVVALEQAGQVGGYLAPFERNGYHFGPGLQYIGMCRQGQFVHEVLSELGIDVAGLFCELDPAGFDVFRFPDLEVRMCRGLEAYKRRLSEVFPDDTEGFEHFFEVATAIQDIEHVVRKLDHGEAELADVRVLAKLPKMLRWARHSLGELLAATLENPHARAVLAAQAGDYGLPPSRASAIVALMTLLHYGDGAFFPRGGSGGLRDAIVQAAEKSGARFRVSTRVRRIVVQDKRVRGVELENGERIDADVIVSDADPTITLGELVEPEHLPPRLRRKVARMEPSLAPFSIFLGMRRDLRERGLGRFNVWTYPSWDIDGLYAPILDGKVPERPWLFVSSNSIKDDSGVLAPAGSSTLEVTTFLSFDMFRRWDGIPPGQRGPEYQALKRQVAERMLSELDRHWPGLVGDVEVQEYATPLTNVDYVGAVQGGGYGPAATPSQWGPFRFSTGTPIQNLFLAGAGVFFHGVASALLSGKEAAVAATGHASP